MNPRLIVALDYPRAAQALALADQLSPESCRLKVGSELFTRAGPAIVEQLVQRGYGVFLDLKFHDIPRTVAQACAAAADLGVWMLNVHALGGSKMMHAAREALAPYSSSARPLLIAVTVLTSHDGADLQELGLTGLPQEHVLRLAASARAVGLDGIVCSAQEAVSLRAAHDANFMLVTPGIRPRDSAMDDQQRIMTPAAALRAGADYLVIGRPITQATNPLAALMAIQQEMDS